MSNIEEVLKKNDCLSIGCLTNFALHAITLDLQDLRDDISHGCVTSKDAVDRLDKIISIVE